MVVITTSEFLKSQLENKYFSKNHPQSDSISHVSVASPEFLKKVYQSNVT